MRLCRGQLETVELRDLRLVIAVSQHRSLRQAAETLNTRQSTLSRWLRDVEYRLSAKLFERTNGGTHPTAAGLEFLETARRILDETDAAFRALKARDRGENGRLTIGICASPSTGNMHATLVEYRHQFPNVEVHVLDGAHDRLLCALAGNAVDVAIMIGRPGYDDRKLPLWSERVIVALPERHPLGQTDVIHWQELANEQILLPCQGPGPELEWLLAVQLRNAHPRSILHQESSLDRLLSLVSAEYGALLMLEGATGVHHDGVIYREVRDDDGPTRLNFVAYWRRVNSNPTLARFLTMLRERYPDLSVNTHRDENHPNST